MILAYHSIFTFYGFWLPNDPRGSGSDYIAFWELFRFGPGTKVNSKRSVAARPRNPKWKPAADRTLEFEPVELNGKQAVAVIDGFRDAIVEGGCKIHACAVLPDHVHILIGRHARSIKQIAGHLKSKATRKLRASSDWTADNRPVWGEHGWNVALDSRAAVERAIRYVDNNPPREGKKRQHWEFVTPFDERAARLVKHNSVAREVGGRRRGVMRRGWCGKRRSAKSVSRASAAKKGINKKNYES